MKDNSHQCFKCNGSSQSPVEDFFGYPICKTCKSKLDLLHDKTIQKYIAAYQKTKEEFEIYQKYQDNKD